MSKLRLDPRLLVKLSKKMRGRSVQSLREQISRRAGKQGISSEAALVLWCRDLGVGATTYLNKQPDFVKNEVLKASIGTDSKGDFRQPATRHPTKAKVRRQPSFGLIVDVIIQDKQLRDRCRDLLTARDNFDRVFREATTVFDDRLKKVSGIAKMKPQDLVGKAINPDPQKAVLEISGEREEQEGVFNICKGIMLAFRNKTHHSLSDKLTREDALKFCGFIDALLAILGQAAIHSDRII